MLPLVFLVRSCPQKIPSSAADFSKVYTVGVFSFCPFFFYVDGGPSASLLPDGRVSLVFMHVVVAYLWAALEEAIESFCFSSFLFEGGI